MAKLEDLKIYQLAIKIRKEIWNLCSSFPSDEKYRLTDQLIRSSRKCPANLAEGFGRFHFQENIQYCRIVRASLLETTDHLMVAWECEYITLEQRNQYTVEVISLIKMLNNYINYLQKHKNER